jgi:hypothetical protein
MEKKETTASKVLDFLSKFNNSTPQAICAGIGVNNKLTIMKVLKGLATDGKVSVNKSPDPPTYSMITKPNATKKENDEVYLRKEGGRDISKLKFQGKEYGKGQLVLAVVKAYIEKNPKISLEKLKEVFADTDLQQSRYGMIQLVTTAKKLSQQSGRDRHFLKSEQILTIGRDKKRVVVSNQWGSSNIGAFLNICKNFGITSPKLLKVVFWVGRTKVLPFLFRTGSHQQ